MTKRASILTEIQDTIPGELQQLHDHIRAALSSGNELMDTVVTEYLRTKGKLIRPILVILTARLVGHVDTRVLSAAAAVEMLHNASLIHDDVVDESATRRGRPTVNSVWDNHIAVLVGDFFVSAALQQAIATDDIRIAATLSRLGKLLSLGEISQINNARSHCFEEQAYFDIISRKTASLFVACVEMGAYACGLDDNDSRLESLRCFAQQLGLCFQIRDDIFDYFDEAAGTIGKPTGNDLREGKVTLPLLYALSRTDYPARDSMLELATRDTLDEQDIDTLYAYARAAGGIDYAYATMERLQQKALKCLEPFGDDPLVEPLRRIIRYIISRDS